MRVLLDTHAFLWWCEGSRRLSAKASRAIAAEECCISVASLWEMAIKISLRKLKLPAAFSRYVVEQIALNGFTEVPLEIPHLAACIELPWHHRDPFDRIIAAQALTSGWPIVSRDPVFEHYGLRRIW